MLACFAKQEILSAAKAEPFRNVNTTGNAAAEPLMKVRLRLEGLSALLSAACS
jgi:hypothetical protein